MNPNVKVSGPIKTPDGTLRPPDMATLRVTSEGTLYVPGVNAVSTQDANNLGLPRVEHNFQKHAAEEVIHPTWGGYRALLYVRKYNSFFAGTYKSACFLKYPNILDFSEYEEAAPVNPPGSYVGVSHMCYSPYKDKIYANLSDFTYNSSSRNIVLYEIDPNTLENALVVNFSMGVNW